MTTADLRAAADKAHTVILKAITHQDGGAAFRRMERRVSNYRDVTTKSAEISNVVDA